MKDCTNNSQSSLKVIRVLNRLDFLFIWTRLFYPKFRGLRNYYLFFYFFPQKVIGVNRFVPWPVHFTSKVLYHRFVTVGANTAPGLSNGCYIQGRNGIRFGSNTRIGTKATIISSDHGISNPSILIKDQELIGDKVTIGENVWIGMNVVVMPGISIGDNVIIGANSTVTKNIPSNSIALGSPCRVIKTKSPYKGQSIQ